LSAWIRRDQKLHESARHATGDQFALRDYLTPERINLFASLPPLHDIGKVDVADRVTNKPGV
jgi:response regulator RpfG family c-di-GMP phosphodiesterase